MILLKCILLSIIDIINMFIMSHYSFLTFAPLYLLHHLAAIIFYVILPDNPRKTKGDQTIPPNHWWWQKLLILLGWWFVWELMQMWYHLTKWRLPSKKFFHIGYISKYQNYFLPISQNLTFIFIKEFLWFISKTIDDDCWQCW